MIHSMTAFARRERATPWGTLVWELRSVNHRYLELAPRLPEELRVIEAPLRERVAAAVQRGKVDCQLRWQSAAQQSVVLSLDTELAKRVVAAAAALALLDEALAELTATRAREGAKLQELIAQRCEAAAAEAAQARQRLPEVRVRFREKLAARLAEMKTELDPQRLEQEMVLLSQRLDVEEKLDRLDAHLAEVRRVLGQAGAVGRRLDFLMQELHREANTLGSNSADVETTRISVEMKVLIEQMREQVQNIE